MSYEHFFSEIKQVRNTSMLLQSAYSKVHSDDTTKVKNVSVAVYCTCS